MIKIENVEVYGFEAAIRAARNPLSSWSKSDSGYVASGKRYEDVEYKIGENDLALLKRLVKAGVEHRTFCRLIQVSMDITAPLYWWKEMDRYCVGKSQIGTSTMHRIMSKPFKMDDFSFENMTGYEGKEYKDVECQPEDEEWKTIDDFPNYKISNFGNVYNTQTGMRLTACVNSSDYKKYTLRKNCKPFNAYAHRLVAKAFIPNPNNFPEVNHIDGNKWNNRADNLEWVSRSQNAIHAFRKGLRGINGYTRYRVGEEARRFSEEEVAEMKRLLENGYSKKKIAECFDCYDSTVNNILNDRMYRKIELAPYDVACIYVDKLNEIRNLYLECEDEELKKKYWYDVIKLLPSSYNQKRTVLMSYEVVLKIIRERENHKLDEWRLMVSELKKLPYMEELLND